jgi:hypothetical protein
MKTPRAAFAAATLLALGCSNQIVGVVGTGGAGGAGGTTTGPSCTGAACSCGATAVIDRLTSPSVDKIDLVLVVDNSAYMAEKQQILALAVPELISGLTNPTCIDETTDAPVSNQPADPLAACPVGSRRAFTPVLDMHVGLLSSSLGTFGADGCPNKPPASCGGATSNSISDNDDGKLVTRTDPCGTGNVPTYQDLGFLAWDPAQKLNPPGTSQVSDLAMAATSLVTGDGQLGCGFESQNESWYRFLVDPTPYGSISLVNNQVQVSGIDQALLAQRKAFLRPDSLLVIVNLSDETDTSLKEYSSYPLFAAPELHLPHPSAGCNFGTADPTPSAACCYSCGQVPPPGCGPDPACTSSPSYTAIDENTALRAFGLISHKARYGIEFFYQPSRYVAALTQPTVTDVNGKTVPNPIYTNLDPASYTGAVRDPSLVFYAPIVGVPWQLLARQKSGVPDLVNGVSALDSTQVGGFKTSAELSLSDGKGNTFWDDIAGDPENYVLARSPFMQESTVPRSGTDPITGAAISPVTTPNGSGSMSGGGLLNDHERTIGSPPSDIEYACVFPLLQPIDCTQPGTFCSCPTNAGETTDNPTCQGTMQVESHAYPGIKHLAIAKGLGVQGIPGSICAKQVQDPTAPDFGYRPSIAAIVSRVSQRLQGPSFDGECLPAALPSEGAACKIIEATNVGASGCNCDTAMARSPVPAADACFMAAAEADPLDQTARWNCFCEITETTGASLGDCQSNFNVAGTTNGWCYLDPTVTPASAPLVASCPAAEQRGLRFTGTGAPATGATIFLACP